MEKNIIINFVITKDDKVIFGKQNDNILINLNNECPLSKLLNHLIKNRVLNDIIGKTFTVEYKKKDTSTSRRVEKIVNKNIISIFKDDEFTFYGNKFKKLTYIKEINDDYMIINDENPLNEDDFKVYIKIKQTI